METHTFLCLHVKILHESTKTSMDKGLLGHATFDSSRLGKRVISVACFQARITACV